MSQCSAPMVPDAFESLMPMKGCVFALPRIQLERQYVRPAVTAIGLRVYTRPPDASAVSRRYGPVQADASECVTIGADPLSTTQLPVPLDQSSEKSERVQAHDAPVQFAVGAHEPVGRQVPLKQVVPTPHTFPHDPQFALLFGTHCGTPPTVHCS